MGKLRASAGSVDLQPPIGGYMTGYAARVDPSTGVHDPIMARALLLDDGQTQLAIISCDLLGFTPAAVADMRRRISEACSIPAGNIFICCTHTHSGPTSLPMRGALGYLNQEWLDCVQAAVVDLVTSLPNSLQPATLGWSSTTVSGIAHNRQDQSHPLDEEFTAIAIDSEGGEPISTLVNYATHAVVLGPENRLYSADFPGALTRSIDARRGGTTLYLQGACGDVNPISHRGGLAVEEQFANVADAGSKLAEAALAVLTCVSMTSDVTISVASRAVDVPLDPPPPLAELDQMIAGFESDLTRCASEGNRVGEQIAQAMLAWADELKQTILSCTTPAHVPAEVFAAAIGDLRIAGLPFETYSDIGAAIKDGVKPHKGIFVGYANGLYGYCPTGWAKDQGGYGPVESCRWFGGLVTPVGYGADDLLVSEAIILANSL